MHTLDQILCVLREADASRDKSTYEERYINFNKRLKKDSGERETSQPSSENNAHIIGPTVFCMSIYLANLTLLEARAAESSLAYVGYSKSTSEERFWGGNNMRLIRTNRTKYS